MSISTNLDGVTQLGSWTFTLAAPVTISSTPATPVSVQLSDGTSQPVDLRAYLRTHLAMQIQQLLQASGGTNGFVPLEIPAFLGAL